ncbi:MAG: hypothetical protein D6815_05780, partial [Candidatus Dadabacteria bacterium]
MALACAVAVCARAVPGRASIAEERKVGEQVAEEARRHLRLVDDYEVQRLIGEIGSRLVAALGTQPFDYEFFVVADDTIN